MVPVTHPAIRAMVSDDIEACARLAATREGDSVDRWADAFTRLLGDDHQLAVVAEVGGRVVGYGKASLLTPASDGGRHVPDGWYLSGVIVDPAHRRQGLGAALTQARLDALAERGVGVVHYVANARNEASLAMHEALGFVEVSRDIEFPGVAFDGGAGVLASRPQLANPPE